MVPEAFLSQLVKPLSKPFRRHGYATPHELDIPHTYILSGIKPFAIRLDIASHAYRIVDSREHITSRIERGCSDLFNLLSENNDG
jgi:hypothetical protein